MNGIKSSNFIKYLAEEVHQTNDPVDTFELKLLSTLITTGIVKSGKHVYYVDFGWNLSNPCKHPTDKAYKTLLEFVEQYLSNLKDKVIQEYQRKFQH